MIEIGTHNICLAVANDFECYDTTCVNIQVGNAGLSDIENSDIRFHPNPTKDFLTIDIDPYDLELVKVCDVFGRIILKREDVQLDFRQLESGKYFVEVETKSQSFVRQVIKE